MTSSFNMIDKTLKKSIQDNLEQSSDINSSTVYNYPGPDVPYDEELDNQKNVKKTNDLSQVLSNCLNIKSNKKHSL